VLGAATLVQIANRIASVAPRRSKVSQYCGLDYPPNIPHLVVRLTYGSHTGMQSSLISTDEWREEERWSLRLVNAVQVPIAIGSRAPSCNLTNRSRIGPQRESHSQSCARPSLTPATCPPTLKIRHSP
jgi:hypothetical protein